MNELLLNANILAFLHVIRTGEGTVGENGYRTIFGGGLFDSFADHPRQLIKRGKYVSTAAGAYQFLSRTWDALRKQHPELTDFSPGNQDIGALWLIKGRKALDDVIAGDIPTAINKCNKEWASLPNSPYGQPTISMAKALKLYTDAGGQLRIHDDPEEKKNMIAPIALLSAVLPSLVNAVPDLIRIFGTSARAENNAQAAEIVINAAKVATGAVNEQDLVEKLASKDPLILEQVRVAVKDVWYELSVDSSGIKEAREVNNSSPNFYKQPAFWITLLILPLVYVVVFAVLGLIGEAIFSTEIQIMVVSAIISGVLGAITGFWLGTSWSSARKTELANEGIK